MKQIASFCMAVVSILGSECALASDSITRNLDQLDKGLTIDFWYGGWEPDYTKTAYETMFSYRGLDKIHLYGGFGAAKQIYYDRSKVFAGGYYFYQDYSYFRAFLSQRQYDYPVGPGAITPNPDSSSYDKVPRLELESSHYFSADLRSTLTYEISRPNFFHDKDSSITVQKLSGEVAFGVSNPKFRPKAYLALLRDPDPNKTEIKGVDNLSTPQGVATATNVAFRTSSLLGGSIQYVEEGWSIESKYLQNRDLDNSYNYSLLNKFVLQLDEQSNVQVDFVYDKFANQSNLAGQTANVYMLSYYDQFSPAVRYGFGIKHIGVPNRKQDTGFVYIQAKTGKLW